MKATIRKAAARLILAKQTRRLVEEKRQVRFQFVRTSGHELKAPLNAVEGYLQLIKDRRLGDDMAAYAEMVDRSLVRLDGMRKLIADLLDMTRIESGQKNRRIEEIDLVQTARAAMETQLPEARARGIVLDLHAEGPVRMAADRGEIEMVLNNLLSNAVKYNRDGGRVDITLGRSGKRVTIAVADTGIGMSEEETSKLFGEFVRIRNEKTAEILGSGLGLSILKKLAALYGGEASVQSTPGAGSRFTVVLQDQG